MFKALNEKKDVVAIKKVALDRLDGEAIRNYQNEIELLRKLRGHEKVIRLDDEETTRSGSGKPKAIFVVRFLFLFFWEGGLDFWECLSTPSFFFLDRSWSLARRISQNFLKNRKGND